MLAAVSLLICDHPPSLSFNHATIEDDEWRSNVATSSAMMALWAIIARLHPASDRFPLPLDIRIKTDMAGIKRFTFGRKFCEASKSHVTQKHSE
jgi:hypothetical protein